MLKLPRTSEDSEDLSLPTSLDTKSREEAEINREFTIIPIQRKRLTMMMLILRMLVMRRQIWQVKTPEE